MVHPAATQPGLPDWGPEIIRPFTGAKTRTDRRGQVVRRNLCLIKGHQRTSTDLQRSHAQLQSVVRIARGKSLLNAKQGSFLPAALLLAACLVTGRCQTGTAQEMFVYRPTSADDLGYPPLVPPREEFAKDSVSDSLETASADLTWSQRFTQLARGRIQLEGGYSYLRGSTGDSGWTQHALPDTLLRVGLTDRWEIRLGWPGYVSSDSDDPAISSGFTGTLDPNIGVLYDLWGQRGWLPQTAILAAVPVPLEGNPFALNSLQPLTELMYSWETGQRTAITGRSGFAILQAAGDNYTQFQQSLCFDVILSERLGGFVSWDMLTNQGIRNDTSQHMGGGGLSFLLTERLSISWRSAFGLNSTAPDFLNNIRFAYRF